jgi:hypothetical protein
MCPSAGHVAVCPSPSSMHGRCDLISPCVIDLASANVSDGLSPGGKRDPAFFQEGGAKSAVLLHSEPALLRSEPPALAPGGRLLRATTCVAKFPGARRVWSGLSLPCCVCRERLRAEQQHIAEAWARPPPPDRAAPRAAPDTPGLKRAALMRRPPAPRAKPCLRPLASVLQVRL